MSGFQRIGQVAAAKTRDITRFFSSAAVVTILLLTSCAEEEEKWSDLPEVTRISKLSRTEFVPTLESRISGNKNTVYATAFLYALDKVKQELKAPIVLTQKNSDAFRTVNQSTSHKNTLAEDEYNAEVETVNGVIIAKAFFKKVLPFPSKLQKVDRPILFHGAKVSAFGIQSYDEEASKFTEILYYKDDDNFILRLTPKDREHQILLVKGITKPPSLMAAVKQADRLIQLGSMERTSSNSSWKYTLNDSDIFSIPVIKFNIETNYSDIEGQVFTANGRSHHIEEAYQRTGFVLNENGAVVESEALLLVDSVAIEPPRILPKKMIFDKPFYVIIKRTRSEHPYFVMHVQNSELLTKE